MPLECGIIFDGIPEGAISRKVGLIWGIPVYKFQIKPEDAAALRELANRKGGPAKMLVLGEDWCGDVIRGLPVLARVAEVAGLDLKIFPRDQHHDIMNEFLKEGQWMFHTHGGLLHCGSSVHLPLDRAARSRR